MPVKYIDGERDYLFTEESGDLDKDTVLELSTTSTSVKVSAENDDFELTFTPFEDSDEESEWSFTCSSTDFTSKGISQQICGKR